MLEFTDRRSHKNATPDHELLVYDDSYRLDWQELELVNEQVWRIFLAGHNPMS